MIRRIKREAHEQTLLFKWASYYPKLRAHLIHIPNGSSRHILEAINLKRQGVTPGVSDIFLALPSHAHHGLWIELKSMRTKKYNPTASGLQQIWIDRMQSVGYAAFVCHGFHEAKKIIEEYIKNSDYKEYLYGKFSQSTSDHIRA